MRRELEMKFVDPSGAKAHSKFTAMRYGLKPVPSKVHSNNERVEVVPSKIRGNYVSAEAVPFKSLQFARA
jgi:hypothetical protein